MLIEIDQRYIESRVVLDYDLVSGEGQHDRTTIVIDLVFQDQLNVQLHILGHLARIPGDLARHKLIWAAHLKRRALLLHEVVVDREGLHQNAGDQFSRGGVGHVLQLHRNTIRGQESPRLYHIISEGLHKVYL